MNKVWVFGDSFTDVLYSVRETEKSWRTNYTNWKGYVPKVYGDILGEYYNMGVVNKGHGGCDNYTILQNVCDASLFIKTGDIVVVQWTEVSRFRLSQNNQFKPLVVDSLKYDVIDFVSHNVVDEILVNRMDSIYLGEINSWINFINNAFKKCHVIHWTPFEQNINARFWGGDEIELIINETNAELECRHFSENGHLQVANKIINLIPIKSNLI
jgi:hypothetical protein